MKQGKIKLKFGDNQPYKPFNIIDYGKLRQLELLFCSRYKISFPCYTMLLMLSMEYKSVGNGLTIFEMSKRLSKGNYANSYRSEIVNTGNKVKILLCNGLIEVSGYGRWNSNIYIPTQRVLKELQEMCDLVNAG